MMTSYVLINLVCIFLHHVFLFSFFLHSNAEISLIDIMKWNFFIVIQQTFFLQNFQISYFQSRKWKHINALRSILKVCSFFSQEFPLKTHEKRNELIALEKKGDSNPICYGYGYKSLLCVFLSLFVFVREKNLNFD